MSGKFTKKQDFDGWETGLYSAWNLVKDCPAVKNTATGDIYYLKPPSYNDLVFTRVEPHQKATKHSEKATREERYDVVSRLPEEVKASLLEIGLKQEGREYHEALLSLLSHRQLITPQKVTSGHKSWEVTADYAHLSGGYISFLPRATSGKTTYWLYPTVHEGEVSDFRIVDAKKGDIPVENLSPPLRKALAEVTCEWAEKMSLTVDPLLPEEISGPDNIATATAVSAARFKPLHAAFPPFAEAEIITDAKTGEQWSVETRMTYPTYSAVPTLQVVAEALNSRDRFAFALFQNGGSPGRDVYEIAIEHTPYIRSSEPHDAEANFHDSVPAPVRKKMVEQAEYLIGKQTPFKSLLAKQVAGLKRSTKTKLLGAQEEKSWVQSTTARDHKTTPPEAGRS